MEGERFAVGGAKKCCRAYSCVTVEEPLRIVTNFEKKENERELMNQLANFEVLLALETFVFRRLRLPCNFMTDRDSALTSARLRTSQIFSRACAVWIWSTIRSG